MKELGIYERIAVSEYLISKLDDSVLKNIIKEVKSKPLAVHIKPDLPFILKKVCSFYQLNEAELSSKSRKQEIINAKKVYVKIVADLYSDLTKYERALLLHKVSVQLNTTTGNVRKLLRDVTNKYTIYQDLRSEITYLSMLICWKFLKLKEDE